MPLSSIRRSRSSSFLTLQIPLDDTPWEALAARCPFAVITARSNSASRSPLEPAVRPARAARVFDPLDPPSIHMRARAPVARKVRRPTFHRRCHPSWVRIRRFKRRHHQRPSRVWRRAPGADTPGSPRCGPERRPAAAHEWIPSRPHPHEDRCNPLGTRPSDTRRSGQHGQWRRWCTLASSSRAIAANASIELAGGSCTCWLPCASERESSGSGGLTSSSTGAPGSLGPRWQRDAAHGAHGNLRQLVESRLA